MCFYYRVSIDGPDKASPTSPELPPLGPEFPCHTGNSDAYARPGRVKAGAMEFLTKPINPDALVATVTAAFERDGLNREKRADIAAPQERFSLLSPREREVLPLVVRGLLNKQSAAALGITEVTLQIHRSRIMQKMLADSLADLVRMAEKLRTTGCDNTSSR
jgi:FixJ family two-component response regulator